MTGHGDPKERRRDQEPVPGDIRSRLTELQRRTLAGLENFGWSVRFVRRPLFQEQVVVLVDPTGQQHAILREDGSIDRNLDIEIR